MINYTRKLEEKISDSIPFKKKINFTFEHGSSNNCSADYKSVAYYYLNEKDVLPKLYSKYFTL